MRRGKTKIEGSTDVVSEGGERDGEERAPEKSMVIEAVLMLDNMTELGIMWCDVMC